METGGSVEEKVPEIGRFQIVGTGQRTILLDTATGRSWRLGIGTDWVGIPFKADAPAAPEIPVGPAG